MCSAAHHHYVDCYYTVPILFIEIIFSVESMTDTSTYTINLYTMYKTSIYKFQIRLDRNHNMSSWKTVHILKAERRYDLETKKLSLVIEGSSQLK